MNVEDFINFIELYYGKYKNAWVKESLIDYLKKEWIYESEIEKLYKSLIRFYSSSYEKNGAPDIAIMEKVDKENRIRRWSENGDRMIPAEEKRQIEKEPIEKDYSKELSKMVQQFKQKQVDGMIDRRKTLNAQVRKETP